MSYKYFADMPADKFIGMLAAEPMELSYDKQREQLIMWKKAAREWLNKNYPIDIKEELNEDF
jgi:hypothetical protein